MEDLGGVQVLLPREQLPTNNCDFHFLQPFPAHKHFPQTSPPRKHCDDGIVEATNVQQRNAMIGLSLAQKENFFQNTSPRVRGRAVLEKFEGNFLARCNVNAGEHFPVRAFSRTLLLAARFIVLAARGPTLALPSSSLLLPSPCERCAIALTYSTTALVQLPISTSVSVCESNVAQPILLLDQSMLYVHLDSA